MKAHLYGYKKRTLNYCIILLLPTFSQAKCWYNLEIHTEVYILIDLCSVETSVIISIGSTKFYPVTIFLFAYLQDGRQSIGSNL